MKYENLAEKKSEIRANMTRYENITRIPSTQILAELSALRVAYALSFILIITTNSILLWRLIFRSKKTRVNILFIILSISDMCVALVSIPLLSLDLLTTEVKLGCAVPCEFMTLFHYFPYFYSWCLTIIIALDRCLVVTKQQKYEA